MKSNFLNNLQRQLYFLQEDEKQQIIADYSTHIDERMKEGFSEQQVIDDLDNPHSIALDYARELGISYSNFNCFLINLKIDFQNYITHIKNKLRKLKQKQAERKIKQASKKSSNADEDSKQISKSEEQAKELPIIHKFKLLISKLFDLSIFKMLLNTLRRCFQLIICIFWLICTLAFLGGVFVNLVVAVLLPFFIAFNTYSITIWLLIYVTILSMIYTNSLIGISCLHKLGELHE